MTKISTYNIDDNVTANDKWIGSDVNNFNKTKNFTPKKLAIYFNGSQVINTGMELLYKYFTITPPETRPVGTISFENEIGPVVSFSSITTFLISKYTQKGNEVNEFLGFLVGTKSLLYKADDINVFGYYDIVSIDPYIDDNNFYVVTLSFIEGNGSIEEDKDYMISMIDINPTEAQDLQNVTDIGSITTNTITAEAFIKHDGDGTNLLLDDGTTIPLNDVGNQSLQDVTDVGNTTDNTIIIDSANYYSSLGPDAVGTENKDTGTYTYIGADGLLGIKNETVESQLKNTDVTNNGVILEFPDKASGSYTIATTSDVETQNLQQVTNEGSTTTNSITANSFIKNDGTGENILLDDGNTLAVSTIPTVTPSALTKVDDTNVTVTLGGSPSTALLQGVSLTLGWTGTLADSRIASAATWNGKENVLTFSSPLSRSVNTVSMPAATTSVDGYLTSTNWNTFNNKENSLGNPAQDGYVLSSTTTGTRSWVAQAAGFEANFLLMGA